MFINIMPESSLLLIVPPIVTASFAYLIAKKKNIISERINRAKIDSESQSQALDIVRGVIVDMRNELHREMDILRNENESLKHEIRANQSMISSINIQLSANDDLIFTLKSEIAILKSALKIYQEENERLKTK